MATSAERKQAAIDELRALMKAEDHEHDDLCGKSGDMLSEFANAIGGELIDRGRLNYIKAITESKGRNNCYTRSARHMFFLSMEAFMLFAEELMLLEVGDMGDRIHETLAMISKMPKDWIDIPTERVEALRARAEKGMSYFKNSRETMTIISKMSSEELLEAFQDLIPQTTLDEIMEAKAAQEAIQSGGLGDMISAIINKVMDGKEIDDKDVLIIHRDGDGNSMRLDRNGFPWAENMDKPI